MAPSIIHNMISRDSLQYRREFGYSTLNYKLTAVSWLLIDEHCLARQCSSLLWQSRPSTVCFSVCPSATNMRWWSCAKSVIARNTKHSRNLPEGYIRVKNQCCVLKGRVKGPKIPKKNPRTCRFFNCRVRLLTWTERTLFPHEHPKNRKYLSNNVRSDWKHPSEKSM